jgi:hypothetical protein
MLRTNYLGISATVVDLKSQHILQWYCHILVVNTAIVRNTMGAPMGDVTSCVIQVVVLHVLSQSQPPVTVERSNKEFHANLPIDQSSAVKIHAQNY